MKSSLLRGITQALKPFTVLVGIAACDRDIAEPRSFALGCTLDTVAAAPCDGCLQFEHEVRLGTLDGPGYLTPRGGIEAVVRDHSGNYWVGQGEWINVYAPSGEFLTTVGREGEGPLEFRYARPFHVDAAGQVHIYDITNLRVSVVDESLALVGEKGLVASPSINSIVPIDDGNLYAIQAWIQTSDLLGLPLHIIDGPRAIRSFGSQGPGQEATVASQAAAGRHLATGADNNIFAMRYHDYEIEAWSRDGALVGRLQGLPSLDDGLRQGTLDTVTPENPPWHHPVDLHIDASGLLWVLLRYRRSDWRRNSVEIAYENGDIALAPTDMKPTNWYQSRIDVIDLDACVRIASEWRDEFFVGFVADGVMAAGQTSQAGVPFLDIAHMTMTIDRSGTGPESP